MQGNWGRSSLKESEKTNQPILEYCDFLRQQLVRLSVIKEHSRYGLHNEADELKDTIVEAINAAEELIAKEWTRQRVDSSQLLERHTCGARIVVTGKQASPMFNTI